MVKRCLEVFFFIFFFSTCSRIGGLTNSNHSYGIVPNKIIWFQIAGLSDEQLPLLKYSSQSNAEKISFEKAFCLGKMWNFNLFSLRPSAELGFLSQMTGSKNEKNTCGDFEQNPLWKLMGRSGNLAGVIEVGVPEGQGLERAFSCKSELNYFKDSTIVWKMGKNNSSQVSQYFSSPNNIPFIAGIYWDKSCQQEGCHKNLTENARAIFEKFMQRPLSGMFIIRDFEYQNLVKSGNILKAKDHLVEMDKLISYFQEFQKRNSESLILITTSGSLNFDFPAQGDNWDELEKSGKTLLFRSQSLMSSVFAFGASSENFCGIYEESEIFNRLLMKPETSNFFNLFEN